MDVRAAPLSAADGEGAVVSSFVDVTERRRMEAELRASEARFRTVIESLHEGVVVQDAEGRVSLWNRSAERLLGMPGEAIGVHGPRDPRTRAIRVSPQVRKQISNPETVTFTAETSARALALFEISHIVSPSLTDGGLSASICVAGPGLSSARAIMPAGSTTFPVPERSYRLSRPLVD